MKKPFLFACCSLSFVLLLPPAAPAQYGRNARFDESGEPEKRFVAGIAPLSLLMPSGKLNLHGEWVYAGNKSLSVIVGVPRKTALPEWLSGNVTLGDHRRTTNSAYHSLGLTAENRFYLAGHAPYGIFLAPYMRYNRIWIDHTAINPEGQGQTTTTGAFGGLGMGGAAGWQFRLGERITLDATFIGVDFKWMRGSLTYSSTNPDDDIMAFRDEVQKQVGDIPIIGKKLSASIEGDKVKVHTPGWLLPGYRFNLSVNYAF